MRRKRLLIAVSLLALFYSGFLGYSYYRGYWPVREPAEYVFGFAEPVTYNGELIVRNDSMGAGHFGAPRGGGRRTHNGVDLYAPIGTPVAASERGFVETGNHPGGYGLFIRLHHENDYVTVYAHLSKILVENDDFVEKGDIIGKVGRTGNADYDNMRPHLHFEIRKNSIPVEPMDYLLPCEEPALN